METNICAGGRAFMKVGRNIVEVRVLEKIGTCWQVSTRTGKTMYARELGEGEIAAGPGPVAALAMIPNWTVNTPQPETAADAAETPAAPSGEAETSSAPEAAETLTEAPASAPASSQAKGLSLLNAAAAVLERSGEPMAVKPIIEAAKARGLWIPTGGKTPEQTLYSAMVREIKNKGEAARFQREDKGRFSFVRRA